MKMQTKYYIDGTGNDEGIMKLKMPAVHFDILFKDYQSKFPGMREVTRAEYLAAQLRIRARAAK